MKLSDAEKVLIALCLISVIAFTLIISFLFDQKLLPILVITIFIHIVGAALLDYFLEL